MNGLEDTGLKAKLAERLHAYMIEVQANQENVDNME